MKSTRFYKQAELLLQILPLFRDNKLFALKGGTAINFFVRNLPRLSVDLDFAYRIVQNRETSLASISENLISMANTIKNRIADIQILYRYLSKTGNVIGLMVKRSDVSIKIETNFIIRGSAFLPTIMELSQNAQDLFGISTSVPVLAIEDLYGGKICAALDRQHPRDLFDIKLLLENEGLTDNIRKAFIVYLLSHSRPMVELLNPNLSDISSVYENEFTGMTFRKISLKELLEAREELVASIRNDLSDAEKRFIFSVKKGEPQWDLFELDHIKELPAVQWKLKNIKAMNVKKHQQAVEKLERALNR